MELLSGVDLVNKTGKTALANHALKGKSVIFLYFASYKDSFTREFLPYLIEAYETSRANGQDCGVEIVMIPQDETKSEHDALLSTCGEWWSVKFGDQVCDMLRYTLGVSDRKSDARLVSCDNASVRISVDGIQDVLEKGVKAFKEWEASLPKIVEKNTTTVTGELINNPDDVKEKAINILIRLLSNIQADPRNSKYRVVRVNNPKIRNELLVANGAWETLLAVGFMLQSDELVLPFNNNKLVLGKYVESLTCLLK